MNGNTIKKTLRYAAKNGWKNAYYTAIERMRYNRQEVYSYEAPSAFALREQIDRRQEFHTKFSILVPTYNTHEPYLRAMIDSVLAQTYDQFELILADASSDGQVEEVVKSYTDQRIRYQRLAHNDGISENTNQALQYVTGDYIGLLDHDDLLTPDALFEMAVAIRQQEEKGNPAVLYYSDEDKCEENGTRFYEPHKKQNFNLDLTLTNNYICHFMVVKAELFQKLKLRKEYDGAQDFDFVLRVISEVLLQDGAATGLPYREQYPIAHLPKVLYHWRCHEGSTAANPDSKQYAYEAGKRAVQDFLIQRGIEAEVVHSAHLGFYRVEYGEPFFEKRPDLGVIGGKVLSSGKKITGGMYLKDKTLEFAGLPYRFSGYMNRASLQQDTYAVDVRCMRIAPEIMHIWEEVFGLPCIVKAETGRVDWKSSLNEEADYKEQSIRFCEAVRRNGYRIYWDPELVEKLK